MVRTSLQLQGSWLRLRQTPQVKALLLLRCGCRLREAIRDCIDPSLTKEGAGAVPVQRFPCADCRRS
jgi:hypothetical protein